MILRTFCPFFVFLFVKYLCLPERRFVIGYIYKKEDCDCRYCLYCRRRKCRAVRCCCLEDKVRTRSPVLNENDKEIYEFYTKGKNEHESLSEEQKEKLEKYCDTTLEMNSVSEREAFASGFRIALRLACAALADKTNE